MSKARNLSDFISDPAIDSTELGSGSVTTDKLSDQSVTPAKLHNTLDLSSKTVTLANDGISGNSVHGGVISSFASTGIDDNASATAITIDSNGKVGIGNNVPDLALDVYGNMGVNGEASRVMVVQSNNVAAAGYGGGIAFGGFYNGATNRINDLAGIQGFKENNTQGDYAGALKFTTRVNGGSPTERMRITSAGNVGIGTSSPSTKLHIVDGNNVAQFGDLNSNSTMALRMSDNPDGPVEIQAYGDTLRLRTHPSGGSMEDRLTILSNGNVGIGTTSPETILHVEGSTGFGVIQIGRDTGANQYQYINFGGNTAGDAAWQIGKKNNSSDVVGPAKGFYVYDLAASVSRLVIDTSGNVGIGTTSPGNALRVVASPSQATSDGAVVIKNEMNNGYETLKLETNNDRDSILSFRSAGTNSYWWGMGIDNSDGGKFKMGADNY